MSSKVNIFWFRRDLRTHDNAGLFYALSAGLPVVPIFIFDKNILDQLEDKEDKRVNFIYDALQDIQVELSKNKSSLDVRYGKPIEIFKDLLRDYDIETVFTNHDYEPYARERDDEVEKVLSQHSVQFKTFKDQVIFEKAEVVKDDAQPYSIFTPYSKRWKALLENENLKSFNTEKYFKHFAKQKPLKIPTLKSMGFDETDKSFPRLAISKSLISTYHQTRDIPSLLGTTRLGIHLRFGTISIRQLASQALELNDTFLNELIWREFFMQMLWHEPRLVTECCKPQYEDIRWRNNEAEFDRWCNGMTGYPIVDAGMRELNATGFMHNRVRMVTASFLVKHLLIDWRWGEAYFAKKLLDYDLAANNGNWQWVAGCGCDAAPYFRIFNPHEQTKRFDPQLVYIRKWVTELDSFNYPAPMVEHEVARERCLAVYKKALAKNYHD